MSRWDEQKLSSPYQVYIEETRTFCNEFASAVKIKQEVKWDSSPLLFFVIDFSPLFSSFQSLRFGRHRITSSLGLHLQVHTEGQVSNDSSACLQLTPAGWC